MTFLQYTPDHTQMVAPGDTCTLCGHPTMSNYFTMYKIVAVIAGAYILLVYTTLVLWLHLGVAESSHIQIFHNAPIIYSRMTFA